MEGCLAVGCTINAVAVVEKLDVSQSIRLRSDSGGQPELWFGDLNHSLADRFVIRTRTAGRLWIRLLDQRITFDECWMRNILILYAVFVYGINATSDRTSNAISRRGVRSHEPQI